MKDLANNTLLNIEGLSLDFRTNRGRVKALRDITFPVRKGRILGLVGESGSGKSTVLWSILGLLAGNAEVTAGRVEYGDKNLLNLNAEGLRTLRGEEISVVFQDPMTSQIPVLPYAQQMSDILYRRSMSEADKRKAAVDMLRRVGIPDPESRVDAYPHEFSGGMRQRAGIAMSMLTGPNLLLADEPTTALDVTMEAQMIDLMRGLRDDFETTIVVVSHNLGLIAEMCDDVVVMYAGEVVETGEVHDIFHNARHPYTRALLECDPARITDVSGKLPVIPGDIPDLTASLSGCIFASRCQKALPACSTTAPPLVERGTGIARCHLLEGPLADPSWPPPAEVSTVMRDTGKTLEAPVKDAKPLLKVRDLNVQFRTMGAMKARLRGVERPFVDAVLDVSLDIRPGETLALVGESGSGKTTLGRTILNLQDAAGGSVRFEGNDIRNMSERRFKPLRRDLAMMFQDPVGSLSPRKSVRALITEPLLIHGAEGRNLDSEAERLADMVRLPRGFLSRYPHELSGGQARRVGVARALALNPRLIVADEPTAGLDVSVQGEILNLMADLQAEHGLSYLIITHNLPVVRHIADRIAIMYLGRIVEEGPAAEVFARPAHPYTRALVEGVPQPDPARRRQKTGAIEGEVPSLLRRPKGCDFVTRCPLARDACRESKPEHRQIAPDHRHACLFPLRYADQPII